MPAIGSDRRPASPLPPTDASGETRRQILADVNAGRNPDFASLREAMRRVDEKDALDELGDMVVAEVQKETNMAATPAPTPPKDLLGRDRIIGLKSHQEGVNPKDRIGASKVDFTLIPTSAKVALALALMDGATKYGAYNWRVEPIQIRTYLGAAERHLEDFKESETYARDSLVQHLGHTMACCAILIDAISQGTVVDDRPINGIGADIIEEANNFIKEKKPEGWGR